MKTIKLLNWEVVAIHPANHSWRGYTTPSREECIKKGLTREAATDLANKLRSKSYSIIKQATGFSSARIDELINCSSFQVRQDSWNVEIDQNQNQ